MTKRKGFTLVELLVVIGVIAILLSLLLPAISRAQESANRTKCSSNLRNWGQASIMFANEHKGWYPQNWIHGLGAQWPALMNSDGTGRTGIVDSAAEWKKYGSTILQLKPYGLIEGVWLCPSADAATPENHYPDGLWGRTQWMNYFYCGGLDETKFAGGAQPTANWNNPAFGGRIAKPAIRTNDQYPAERILAADEISYESRGWWLSLNGGRSWRVNHPVRGKYSTPAFQNILYADGHVEGKTGVYRQPLTGSNYSFSSMDTAGPWAYWGQ